MPGADAKTIAHYNRTADEYVARTRDADLGEIRCRFLSLVKPGGRILDVGSGSGRDLKAFRQQGFVPIGIEPSAALAERARKYSGETCVVRDVESLTWRDEFDGIWACASLLHLPKASLPNALQRLSEALRPGGVLYVSVRSGEGERRLPDGRYFADYTEAELRKLVASVPSLQSPIVWASPDSSPHRQDVEWISLLALRKGAD